MCSWPARAFIGAAWPWRVTITRYFNYDDLVTRDIHLADNVGPVSVDLCVSVVHGYVCASYIRTKTPLYRTFMSISTNGQNNFDKWPHYTGGDMVKNVMLHPTVFAAGQSERTLLLSTKVQLPDGNLNQYNFNFT